MREAEEGDRAALTAELARQNEAEDALDDALEDELDDEQGDADIVDIRDV